MHDAFRTHVEALPTALERLVAMRPVQTAALPRVMPDRGVYLCSEGDIHLYVGRSNRLRARIRNHGNPVATHKQAAFAFRLARETTGRLKASYRPEGSRRALMEDVTFAEAFKAAKVRIARMHVRFVEETDPIRQCLLEVYVALALGARYNDFDNH